MQPSARFISANNPSGRLFPKRRRPFYPVIVLPLLAVMIMASFAARVILYVS